MVLSELNEIPILVLAKSAPPNSYINFVELFMGALSFVLSGTTFSRVPMSAPAEKAINRKSRAEIRKMCKGNDIMGDAITESITPVIETVNDIMKQAQLKGNFVEILNNPTPDMYTRITKVLLSIDPSFKDVSLTDINSTMLRKHKQFMSEKDKWIFHDSPYCRMLGNPRLLHKIPDSLREQIMEMKIPIPNTMDGGHYKDFDDVYGKPESLTPVVLPTSHPEGYKKKNET